MKQIFAITRKELYAYFSSPMALIFIGVFVAAVLFTFFWLDTFFARGLADVRSLFRWMPLLLVFLTAALTMRQWSEEESSGTLEILLTLPVAHWQLVVGKFLAVMTLITLALALTISLPITVAALGDIDRGPVVGGYLASLLLAAALVALGLCISAGTRNEIVALILTSVIGLILYLVGTPGFAEFFGDSVGGILRSISTSSRFESIQRGVVDLRDLVYYATLSLLFLALNTLMLDTRRWSVTPATRAYRRRAGLITGLVVANLIATNIWLAPLAGARLDLTEQREYTLSPPTHDLINSLEEPLLIRGHFSNRTHPLLAPLVPRVVDMLREYEAAANGMIRVEVVDPAQDPELEAEAAQSYGIRPTPFQIADRYESAVVNAYFDILVRYGDQSEVINFQSLIEVEAFRDGEVDVRLRNLEYDLTRAIQRTVYGFQDINSLLDALPAPARITLFATDATLPPELAAAAQTVATVVEELAADAPGRVNFQRIDPDAPSAAVTRRELQEVYGLEPFLVSIFDQQTFYFHMVMELDAPADDPVAQARAAELGMQILYPTADITAGEVRTILESGLQRFSAGFLQVVGLWQPTLQPDPAMAQFGQNQPPIFGTWDTLFQSLQQEYEVRRVDLSTGSVAPDIDVLVVVAPQNMSDVERYAIDQFLMRGGAVVAAVAQFQPGADPFTGELTLTPVAEGIAPMLEHYGVQVAPTLVLDPQNEPFPMAVARDVGGTAIQEIQAINYPYFVDVRSDGMDTASPLSASLPAITLNWVSPVSLDAEKTAGMETATLLRASNQAWTSDSLVIQPDLEQYPEYGFPVAEDRAEDSAAYPLAVSLIGTFPSYFAGQPNPLTPEGGTASAGSTIEQSPATARLIVVGSGHFLNDTVFSISSQMSMERYLNSLRFVQNAVDWSTEDLSLLAIRARGSYARLLQPLSDAEQTFWELFNYGFALAGLIIIGLAWVHFRRSETPMHLVPRAELDSSEHATKPSANPV